MSFRYSRAGCAKSVVMMQVVIASQLLQTNFLRDLEGSRTKFDVLVKGEKYY